MAEDGFHKTRLSKETLFLWADIQYLSAQPSITKEDIDEFLESYFVDNCILDLSKESQIELKEILLKGGITKENLKKPQTELFDLIVSEGFRDSIHNFAIASVYCKRMRKFYIPFPDVLFGKVITMAEEACWKRIYHKSDIEFFRKKKRFSNPHFYVSKAIVSLRLPKEKCMDLLDFSFSIKQDQGVKELHSIEDLSPEASVCYVRVKNPMGHRDYCVYRAMKTFEGDVSVALCTSVDHVGAKEKKGVSRGCVPFFVSVLRPVTDSSCEFVEIACLSLDGMKLLSIITGADFLAGIQTGRYAKVRDAIYKQNTKNKPTLDKVYNEHVVS